MQCHMRDVWLNKNLNILTFKLLIKCQILLTGESKQLCELTTRRRL